MWYDRKKFTLIIIFILDNCKLNILCNNNYSEIDIIINKYAKV